MNEEKERKRKSEKGRVFKTCQTECVDEKGRLVKRILVPIFTSTIDALLLLSTLLSLAP